uniref:Reverse transcriptase domain-containing protein n=1 Tax=Lactuca sativa TaxID=4236 RepID=A0A9R1VU14_LACSA|nr:hypothetical protein LSAT_V11C400216830 [Lactuca sativa]
MAIGEWTEVRQRRRRHQEDHNSTKSMATSFFFLNFPDDWDEKALWQTFQRYGTIVDLYLARKRNIKNKRFGFARFIRIENISDFERKLNGIWIGNYKLRVNLARFQRKSTANPRPPMPLNGHRQTKQPFVYPHLHPFQPNSQDAQNCIKSYAEVIAGDKMPKETTNPNPIRMTSFEETREFMKRALVGEVENFQALMNVRAFPEVEECPTVVMRYLGGMKMLVEFESEDAKTKFLVDGRQIWNPRFKTMYNWNPKENFNVRIASIMIFGVPQHAWCEEAFSVIARKWGTVIIPEECATDNPNMAFGRVGILTSHPQLINQSITISVDESPFSITVLEDLLESTRLSPVVASNEFALNPNPSPKWIENSYWEDLHESSVEDLAEEGEINSSDDEDFVCSPVHGTNSRIPSKSPVKPFREAREESPVNNNRSHNSQGSTRNPRSPDAASEEFEEPFDHMGNFSPQSLQNPGSVQNIPAFGKEAQSKSPNGPNQEGSTSLISPRQKSPMKTNQIDLNSAPVSSDNVIPLLSQNQHDSQSIHQVGNEKSNTEDEVSQTIEIGERIGFQVQGGVGCEVKRDWIKNIRRDNKVFLLGLQETKLVEIKRCLDRSIWGDSNFQCEVSDPVGLSGGIATIWNPNQFKLSEAISGNGYLLTKGEWIPSKAKYTFVNVYASNDPGRRKLLWAELENILNAHSNSRWVIFGDFNEVRAECERLGSSFCISSANHFNNFISSVGLIDLQMGGRRFTYMSSDGGKHSKLDRFLVSYNTISDWPQLQVTVLPRLYSDHWLILLSSPICDYGPSPFRFFNSWLQDESLDNVVVAGWTFDPSTRFFASLSPLSIVAGKLKNTKGKIKDLRKSKNVEANMKRQDLIEKINKIDLEAECGVANPNSIELRKHFHKELLEIESKRISDLKQKARCKWALEGDENSVKEEAVKHFYAKFKESKPCRPTFTSLKFKKLPPENSLELEAPISFAEVRSAVWMCGSDKSPGPDGFSFAFLKKYWEVIGGDIYMAVKDFERSGTINKGCNSSFITLVPKSIDPNTFDDYRPISLLGSLYKIISKVLAERLKKAIPLVISDTQTAFIKDRYILDGPLIVNEVISWLRKNKAKAFLLKIDFEKAFDCLNWGFLESVMAQMEFGGKWRSWIQGCLSSARASVIVNGSATKKFSMERGIRQGDPLSPFLFILAAEGLNVAMEEVVEQRIFKGISLPRSGPVLSHLQYVDDVIFLGAWSISNAKNLIRILRCFELASGLKINMSKSKIYGIGVNNLEIELLARSIYCSVGCIPFSYLEMPVGAVMSRVSQWSSIINKFQSRLSKWKASSLSFGGRLTLCKAVLGSLGTYFFSLYKAPVKIINTLESYRRRFFWGGSTDKNKMSWIAWDKVLASVVDGGLGVGSLKAQNLALLGKWWWRFKSNKKVLWKDVITAIYGKEGGFNAPSRARRKGFCWGTIVNLHSDLSKLGRFWKLGSSGIYTNHLVPRKVNILAWRVNHGRLPTKENLFNLGIGSNPLCTLCNQHAESESHLFTTCSVSLKVWSGVASWWHRFPPGFQSVKDLLHCKVNFQSNDDFGLFHEAVALVFIWVIWSFRNKMAYSEKRISPSCLINDIQTLSYLWINVRHKTKKLRWLEWCCNPIQEAGLILNSNGGGGGVGGWGWLGSFSFLWCLGVCQVPFNFHLCFSSSRTPSCRSSQLLSLELEKSHVGEEVIIFAPGG